MTGGEIKADSIYMEKAVGTLDVSGTALISLRNDLGFGKEAGGDYTMNMSGGTVNVADSFEMTKANEGDAGQSILNMSGGVLNTKLFKMAQKGGVATVNFTGGLITASESFNVPHNGDDPVATDQTGTTAHLTLGDGSNPAIVLGDATIDAVAFNMDNAYAVDGKWVDAWVDFQPGGLLLVDGDVVGDLMALRNDGMLLTTYSGGYFGVLAPGDYLGVVFDRGITSPGQTAAYLGVIPEPATMLLLGFGGLLLRRKKRVS